jgi:hypothetical protein
MFDIVQNKRYLNEYIFQEVELPYSYLQQILNLLLLILKLDTKFWDVELINQLQLEDAKFLESLLIRSEKILMYLFQ